MAENARGGADARWVDSQAALEEVVDCLAGEALYAVDTEFHRERTYWPHLALVQLAWPGGLVLVDPLAVDVTPLARVLRGEGTAVLHAADQDLEVLERACGAVPTSLFDTQVAAGFLGFTSPGLGVLVERLLGRRLAKGDRLTDWTRRPLTAGQRAYAADDVAHLLDLHRELSHRLAACGRMAWAEQECRILLERPRGPQDPATAWWRIKDSRSLRGASRGVAQELAAWREQRAAQTDRPVRTVLSDLAILGIAHRLPNTEDELRGIRGLDGRHIQGGAARAILAAVGRGRELAPGALRLPKVDELDRNLRPAATLVAAWTAQLARDLKLDPALLATRADLVAFIAGDRSVRLSRGWRHELVGEPVRRLVAGEAAVAFRPGSGELVLEERSGRILSVEAAVPEDGEDPVVSGDV